MPIPGDPLPLVPPTIQPTSEVMQHVPGFWDKRRPVYGRNKIVGSVPCEDPENWEHIVADGYVTGWRRRSSSARIAAQS